MTPSLLAIRAIATELAYRVYKPIVVTAIIVGVISLSLMVWLVMMSAWWLFLAVPVFFALVVVALLLVFTGITIRIVSPRPNREQKKQVADFVNKIQGLSEITATPKLFLLFRVIRDVMVPSRTGYVQGLISDTTSLKKDFTSLLDTFS